MQIILLVFVGLAAGVLSGMFGIGGGIIIVPALIYFLHMSQHLAQGTTLALMLPPIGLLAVLTYHRSGNVNITAAAFICLGFIFGSYFGSLFAEGLSNVVLRKLFGVFLLIVSVHMIFFK